MPRSAQSLPLSGLALGAPAIVELGSLVISHHALGVSDPGDRSPAVTARSIPPRLEQPRPSPAVSSRLQPSPAVSSRLKRPISQMTLFWAEISHAHGKNAPPNEIAVQDGCLSHGEAPLMTSATHRRRKSQRGRPTRPVFMTVTKLHLTATCWPRQGLLKI